MKLTVETRQSVAPPRNSTEKLFICLSGSSESGKSSFSKRMLHEHSANRIKYLKATHCYGTLNGASVTDPFYMLSTADEHQRMQNEIGTWQTIDQVASEGNRISVIESLKHPNLLHSFGKAAIDACIYVIYIDADINIRVDRESSRLNVPGGKMLEYIIDKDSSKAACGLYDIRERADLVIQNNGTETEYYAWIDEFASHVHKLYNSKIDSPGIEYL